MREDFENEFSAAIQRPRSPWLLYIILCIVSVASLTGLAYLHSIGWRITIDTEKLASAFKIQGQSYEIPAQEPELFSKQNTEPLEKSESREYLENYTPPQGSPPINWDIQIRKFNSIYVEHPSCDPYKMQWTQMECSNFRARALKRFQQEWSKNSYWNGTGITANKDADLRVNSELREN